MAIPQIKTDGDVQRKYLACAIDISDTETPEYLVIGYRITDSSIEFNADTETGTDINGRNFGSVNNFEPQQTFEPHRLTSGELGSLGAKMIEYFRKREMQKFSQFKCIIIYGFLADNPDAGPYPADLYDACTLTPNSLGGESWTEMPFDVVYGGNVTTGSVTSLINKTVFTPAAP